MARRCPRLTASFLQELFSVLCYFFMSAAKMLWRGSRAPHPPSARLARTAGFGALYRSDGDLSRCCLVRFR